MFNIFLILAQNIDCGYPLEPPCRGSSNVYSQSMFWSKNKKIGIHCIPQFYYIKVGFKEVNISRTRFPDERLSMTDSYPFSSRAKKRFHDQAERSQEIFFCLNHFFYHFFSFFSSFSPLLFKLFPHFFSLSLFFHFSVFFSFFLSNFVHFLRTHESQVV